MRELKMTVTEEQAGRRVQSLLKERFGFAASLLSHLKYVPGTVRKNGEEARLADRAEVGDVLTVYLESSGGVKGEFPLPVLYEDEDLLVISKPAGMAVYGAAERADTVESFWKAEQGENIPFHAVNRLDRGTSGLMVLAKNGHAHDRLRGMLHTEDFQRSYLALVAGEVTPESGKIDLPIHRENRKSFISEEGKAAVTLYETTAKGGGCTLLRLQLMTGRTHQIRVHCAAIGHPLLGDALYGGDREMLQHPALHSASISLRQPVTGELIRVEAELPEDMQALCLHLGMKKWGLE